MTGLEACTAALGVIDKVCFHLQIDRSAAVVDL